MLPRLISLLAGATALTSAYFPDAATASDTPTYWESIHPILERRCVSCHSGGGAAPFALDTYESAYPHALLMSVVVAGGTMPLGVVGSDFESADWKSLRSDEVMLFKAWVNGGAPEGVRKATKNASSPHFTVPPDRIVKLPQMEVPLTGAPVWRTVTLELPEGYPIRHFELDWASGRVARAVELEVVHGLEREFLGRSMVGQPPLRARSSPKVLVEQGDQIRLHLRLHPDGLTREIRPSLGLHRGDVDEVPVVREWKEVAPAAKVVEGKVQVARESLMIAEPRWLETIVPPSSPWIRRAVVSLVRPDQPRRTLGRFDVWRPHNYGSIRFRPSIELPPGSRIEVEATYDNSPSNPLVQKALSVLDTQTLLGRERPTFRLKLVLSKTLVSTRLR